MHIEHLTQGDNLKQIDIDMRIIGSRVAQSV
jgi:hypothetical protein